MHNLFLETVGDITDAGYSWPQDIDFIIGDGNKEVPIELFELNSDREYDAGYGRAEVDQTLIIVMKDGNYFERAEYDGAEWWELVETHIKRPTEKLDAYDPFY